MHKLINKIIGKFSYNIRSPFDLKLFKQDSKSIIQNSLNARFRDVSLATKVSGLLDNYKKNLFQLEQLNKAVNSLQKQIKLGKKKVAKDPKEQQQILNEQKKRIIQISQIKAKQQKMQYEIKDLIQCIEQNILKIGNIVDSVAPVSKDQANNKILKTYQPETGFLQHSVSYSDICEKFDLTDLKRGQKVGGHRGYFLKNSLVKISLALANYGLKFLQSKGYQVYYSPAIISQSTLRGSCQLQTIQQDSYKLEGMNSYLIATSQQSLAGLYKDQVLMRNKLPVRMAGYSTCFRKQAGAHGKDIHGIFRVHQFQKVEQFTIVQPQKSAQEMNRMLQISEQFYKALQIPYQVVNIVSAELNDAASCKYDLQAWYPSQKRYRQLVSISNCTQYQSRLLKTQYSAANNQIKYPHMLNGTLVAIQRALTCIIQNNYYGQYIRIPKQLQSFVGMERIEIPKKSKKNNTKAQ